MRDEREDREAAAHHGHEAPRFDQEWWDERYSSYAALWSGDVNPLVPVETAHLTPGSALDLGCGEGADAIWLATRGWQVTGVDVSAVALERAAAHADEVGVQERIVWERHDAFAWTPPAGAFDLVSAQFFHVPAQDRGRIYRGLADAVAPGGTLLVVAHHPVDVAEHGPDRPAEMFFTPEQLAEELEQAFPAEWDLEVVETRGRHAVDRDGVERDLHDALVRARRVSR
jgi:SAM-dependent methyltransferase